MAFGDNALFSCLFVIIMRRDGLKYKPSCPTSLYSLHSFLKSCMVLPPYLVWVTHHVTYTLQIAINCSWTTEGTIASCNSAMVSIIWIRFWTNLRVTWNFSFTPAPQKIKKIAWKWKLKLNDLKIDHSCCDIWERKIILKMCLNVSRISSGFTHKKVGWIFGNTEWRKKSKATKKGDQRMQPKIIIMLSQKNGGII